MKKILIICLMLIGMIGKAQQRDTIANVIITVSDSIVTCYHLDYTDSISYKDSKILTSRLQPELNNYLIIARKDYCTQSDTLQSIMYQNVSQSMTCERFIIKTKDNKYFPCLTDLSLQLQESIYLFSLKLKAIIKDEN